MTVKVLSLNGWDEAIYEAMLQHSMREMQRDNLALKKICDILAKDIVCRGYRIEELKKANDNFKEKTTMLNKIGNAETCFTIKADSEFVLKHTRKSRRDTKFSGFNHGKVVRCKIMEWNNSDS